LATGIPVTNDAIVGKRRAGATAVADQVTDPSFTRDDKTGITPLFNDSWPSPSKTNRMTCSVAASGAEGAPPPRAAKAMDEEEENTRVRPRNRAIRNAAAVIENARISLMSCLTRESCNNAKRKYLSTLFSGKARREPRLS